MHFHMKINPIDIHAPPVKTLSKSRLKRLFERQFTPSVLKTTAGEFEPSSVCLAKMVHNFIEGNRNDASSEDESELFAANSMEEYELLKCSSVCERNLLAETERIVENNNKICKRQDELCRKIVTNGLLALGYDASSCKTRWEKFPSCPASGEYEYIDVIIEGERLIVDVDFRSEFEIARPTKAYKAIIQTLPNIYVGKSERLQRIVGVVSEAAKRSLKKRGMPVPPWRKAQYVMSKWLASDERAPGHHGFDSPGPSR